MLTHKDLPVYSFRDSEEFNTWLTQHHSNETGFWLRYFKKGSGKPTILHGEAIDVALCWGWIDGLINKYDDISYVVRFTPRSKKSVWSQVNVNKVQRLIENGKMQPSGLKLVEEAKLDGRWDKAYAPPSTMTVPEDFVELLKQNPNAYHFFLTLNKANLYATAYRLHSVTDPQKRMAKMLQIIDKLERKESFH